MTRKRRLTRQEKALPVWQAAMQKAWLRDHPGKTRDDYERAGSCTDTARGEQAFHKWYAEWADREGEVIRRRLFEGVAKPLGVAYVGSIKKVTPMTVLSARPRR